MVLPFVNSELFPFSIKCVHFTFESVERGCDIHFPARRISCGTTSRPTERAKNMNFALLPHGCSVVDIKNNAQPAKFGNDVT